MLIMLNKLLWGIATIMIFGIGLYFTFKLNFVQFYFKDMLQSFKFKSKDKNGVSPFESLMIALGGKLGVGSLAGIALSIYLGGPGTIFWMWITGIIATTTAFAETVLGVIYQEKDYSDVYKGGPAFYIKKGLNNQLLANIYSVVIIFAYIGGFLTIQANTIVKSINSFTLINPLVIGLIIAIITIVSIIGNVKEIANVTAKLVPIMVLLYLLMGLYVIICHLNIIPSIFITIIRSAFNIKSFGFGILTIIIIGIQRGIFANEAGLGTGAIAASMTKTNPCKQGFTQIIGVYITTIIIATITTIIIMTSNYNSINLSQVNGIEITQFAFHYHFGNFGSLILCIIVILFAYSTIIAGYYYGESNLKYLITNIKYYQVLILKLITTILVFFGSLTEPNVIWQTVDIFVAILAIINIYAIIKLRGDVIFEWINYLYQKRIAKTEILQYNYDNRGVKHDII